MEGGGKEEREEWIKRKWEEGREGIHTHGRKREIGRLACMVCGTRHLLQSQTN